MDSHHFIFEREGGPNGKPEEDSSVSQLIIN